MSYLFVGVSRHPEKIQPPREENIHMKDKHLEMLQLAAEVAQNSQEHYKVAAIIVHRNKVVSVGINSRKTDPFQAKFNKHYNPLKIHKHAEIAAIKQSIRHLGDGDYRRATIYVARIKRIDYTKNGWAWGLAKPCEGCQGAIDEFEIGRIVYTVKDLEYEVLDVK